MNFEKYSAKVKAAIQAAPNKTAISHYKKQAAKMLAAFSLKKNYVFQFEVTVALGSNETIEYSILATVVDEQRAESVIELRFDSEQMSVLLFTIESKKDFDTIRTSISSLWADMDPALTQVHHMARWKDTPKSIRNQITKLFALYIGCGVYWGDFSTDEDCEVCNVSINPAPVK